MHKVERAYDERVKDAKEEANAGLCASCVFMRRVVSDRGSVFYFCERSLTDVGFQKYPRLPVVSCSGYEEASRT